MGYFNQLKLLLWKNLLIQMRKKCVTVFEILLPVGFAALLVLFRFAAEVDKDLPVTFNSFPLNCDLLSYSSIILYSPNNSIVRNLLQDVKDSSGFGNEVITRGFTSEEELVEFYRLHPREICCAIVFDESWDYESALPNDVHYTLRFDGKWNTDKTYPFYMRPGPSYDNSHYEYSGFLNLQYCIDRAIIKRHTSGRMVLGNVSMQKMPYPVYYNDDLTDVLKTFLPQVLMLSFILSTMQLTKSIIQEKENKLKETMKLMGLGSSVYWMSWFIKDFLYLLLGCLIYVLLCTLPLSNNGSVLQNSDPVLLYLFLVCYSLSIIAFCFMISTMFKKANNGLYAAGILHFFTYFPYLFVESKYESWELEYKIGISFLHNMCMCFGLKSLTLYESTGEGVQWWNFYKPAIIDDNFTFLYAILMFLLDAFIYFTVAWYIDNVTPGEYGVPRPFYFPFMKSYWFGTEERQNLPEEPPLFTNDSMFFEREPADLNVGISMENLRKKYGKGEKEKVAVVGTTLNIFEGEITALLGHNGAGKTTTMSMLTGFIQPSSGSATVSGFDITKDITNVRKNLGVCPQHNILFDTLTVQEHLEFYAGLKECPKLSIKQEVDKIINVLNLELKRNSPSLELSGGQKRKLSVGIALIGGSKIIILDEPTSGMDPGARRETWEILKTHKERRTILFSTHMMDEADILGNRIAIMHEGVVKCCGTALFLKKLYGAGYHLVIVKEQNCIVEKLVSFIQKHIPNATLEGVVGAEVSVLLPFEDSSRFESLFMEMENQCTEMGISSFGISATTMEEVFLKVGEQGKVQNQDRLSRNEKLSCNEDMDEGHFANFHTDKLEEQVAMKDLTKDQTYIEFNIGLKKNTAVNFFIQKCFGMFVKKFLHTIRNKTVSAVQLILPVVFTILALLVDKQSSGQRHMQQEPKLDLTLTPFKPYAVTLYSYRGNSPDLAITAAAEYSKLLSDDGYSVKEYKSHSANGLEEYMVELGTRIGEHTMNKKYIVAAEFESNVSDQVSITALFNDKPYHSPPISLSYISNALLNVFANSSHSILTSNHPLPDVYEKETRTSSESGYIFGVSIAITILLGMSFLTASFVIFPIRERKNGSKHLQIVSGVGPLSYWLSALSWDLINYLIPVILILILFLAFQTHAYIDDGRIGLLFLVFFCYGLAVIPFVYFLQFLFKSPACGMVSVSILGVLTGLGALLSVTILKILKLSKISYAAAALITDWTFTVIIPHHGLGGSLLNIYSNYKNGEQYRKLGVSVCGLQSVELPICRDDFFTDNYMAWDDPGCGRYVVFLLLQGLFYFAIVLLIDYGLFFKCFYGLRRLTKSRTETVTFSYDSDVLDEKQRIESTSIEDLMQTDSVIIKNLSKRYGISPTYAVENICVGIPKQECFGLLGQNGAGKTSTIKMLTGDITLTSGNAYINNFDIEQNLKKVHENLGYCPQFDGLIDQLTGREILTMFARLRGVNEKEIKRVVQEILDNFTLQEYADKCSGNYSGGNKRKLSTAIAIIGDPPFILLDEPTTGVDPVARRQLWNVLSQIRASGRTLILTSHSMEECDALCTRLVIMVNGKFVCLGSPQHLKNKFGQGLTLVVRLRMEGPDPAQPIIQYIQENFPSSHVFDDHQGYLHFQIPDRDTSLAQVFGAMEKAKDVFSIDDYSVHQTTLEQVFLAFTRNQIVYPKFKQKCLSKLCGCLVCCK